MSLVRDTTSTMKVKNFKRIRRNSDSISFSQLSNTSSCQNEISFTLEDFLSMSIVGVVSELFYHPVSNITHIIHLITIHISITDQIYVIHKQTQDLVEMEKYLSAVYSINAPSLPKKSQYPLRDVELTQYLQEVIYNNQALQCISLHHPQMSGDLKKESYLLKRWKNRFVVIKNTFLFYFASKENKQTYSFSCDNSKLLNEWLIVLSTVTTKPRTKRTNRNTKKLTLIELSECVPWCSVSEFEKEFTPHKRSNELVISKINLIKEEATKLIQTYQLDPFKTDVVALLKQFCQIQLGDLNFASIVDYYNTKLVIFLKENPQLFYLFQLFKDIREFSDVQISHSTLTSSPLPHSSKSRSSISSSTPTLKTNSYSKRTFCRLCNTEYCVGDLTIHTYYCKLCNGICENQTTHKARLVALANEIQKQQKIHRGGMLFGLLYESALKAAEIDVANVENINQFTDIQNRLEKGIEENNDITYKTFACIILKIIKLRSQLFQTYVKPTTEGHEQFKHIKIVMKGVKIVEPLTSWQKFSEGAYSKLYLVKKKTTGDIFAMKVLKKNVICGVLAEKQILQLSNTRSIVKLYYAFQDANNLFLVMEYCPGGDLRCVIRMVETIKEKCVQTYTAEIILALEYIHSLGCIHRDLKPDNVLIDKNGHLLLSDFGLSVVGSFNDQKGIKESLLLCTPDYVAPESVKELYYCQASDYFSLGCMVYEMLVGTPPFNSNTVEEIFEKIEKGSFIWPSDIVISDCCKDFVSKLLTKDPSNRLGAKGAQEVKCHEWLSNVSFDSLLSESRDDIFVPELDDDTDTGYFNIMNSLSDGVSKDDMNVVYAGVNSFSTFDCTLTHQLLSKNIEIFERTRSAVNLPDGCDENMLTVSMFDDNTSYTYLEEDTFH
ncbi:non-specific serine/threonine protein kinase [Entamoeba marina]